MIKNSQTISSNVIFGFPLFFFLSLNLNKKDNDFQVKEGKSYECHKSVYLLLKKDHFDMW